MLLCGGMGAGVVADQSTDQPGSLLRSQWEKPSRTSSGMDRDVLLRELGGVAVERRVARAPHVEGRSPDPSHPGSSRERERPVPRERCAQRSRFQLALGVRVTWPGSRPERLSRSRRTRPRWASNTRSGSHRTWNAARYAIAAPGCSIGSPRSTRGVRCRQHGQRADTGWNLRSKGPGHGAPPIMSDDVSTLQLGRVEHDQHIVDEPWERVGAHRAGWSRSVETARPVQAPRFSSRRRSAHRRPGPMLSAPPGQPWRSTIGSPSDGPWSWRLKVRPSRLNVRNVWDPPPCPRRGAATSTRLAAPSFRRMHRTWDLTVCTPIARSSDLGIRGPSGQPSSDLLLAVGHIEA